MNYAADQLADYVNSEPIVFMDCTSSEIVASITIAGVTGFAFGIVLGVVIGLLMVGIVIGLLLILGMTYGLLVWMRSVRQKHYETWLAEKLFLINRDIKTNYFGATLPFINETKRYGKGVRSRG